MTGSGSGGAATLMGLAIFQRLITFGLNTVLLRYISAEVLGFASNDMELMLSSILFVSREFCRVTVMRAKADFLYNIDSQEPANVKQHQLIRQTYVNIAWLPVPLGLLLTAGCLVFFHPEKHVDAEEQNSFYLFALAAAIEVLAEPFYIMANSMLQYNLRARAEVAGVVIRSVTTFLCAAFLGYRWQAFAIGQAIFAVIQLVVYSAGVVRMLQHNNVSVSAAFPSMKVSFSSQDQSLLAGLFLQNIVKHVLTEGDRLLLTALTSREERGIYAVVVNYGSLPVRFFFQPLEESLRNSVSKVIAENSSRQQVATLLEAVGRIVIFIGGIVSVFGYSFAPIGVNVLFGKKWGNTDLGAVLGLYCVYVVFLAFNGATEAVATAAADASRARVSTLHMSGAFMAYACVSLALLPTLGLRGVIIANALNMLLRTISSTLFISNWCKQRSVVLEPAKVLPSSQFSVGISICSALLVASKHAWSGTSLMDSKWHILLGMVAAIILAVLSFRKDLKDLKAAWRVAKGVHVE